MHARSATEINQRYRTLRPRLLMCMVIVGVNTGIGAGYIGRVLKTYMLAMPVAFFCVLGVRPVVMKLVAATVDLG